MMAKSAPRRITALGRTQTVAEWAKETGLSAAAIAMRLHHGWEPERAVTEPIEPNRRLITVYSASIWVRSARQSG